MGCNIEYGDCQPMSFSRFDPTRRRRPRCPMWSCKRRVSDAGAAAALPSKNWLIEQSAALDGHFPVSLNDAVVGVATGVEPRSHLNILVRETARQPPRRFYSALAASARFNAQRFFVAAMIASYPPPTASASALGPLSELPLPPPFWPPICFAALPQSPFGRRRSSYGVRVSAAPVLRGIRRVRQPVMPGVRQSDCLCVLSALRSQPWRR